MVVYGLLNKGHLCLFIKGADNKESMAGCFYAGFSYLVGDPSSILLKAITILIVVI
jgi:hypothetical protein